MASGKNSFVLYVDLINTLEKLSDDKAGRLFKHILRYVNDLSPEPPDELTDLLFVPIKSQLKRDLEKWDSIRERNHNNGMKGGRPKTQTNQENPVGLLDNPSEPKKAVTVTESVTESVTVIEKNKSNTANKSPKPDLFLEFYPFEEFWNDYDKKVGDKIKLQKKWDSVKLSDRELIKEFIPKYKESEPAKKYRKNAETFLNNKSWNDEIILNNNKPKTHPTKLTTPKVYEPIQ